MSIVKLDSFRIKNYRSIIDSGWKNLSSDNITVLIGQNESGKTSVLEALQSFHTGLVSEDILRSDQSLPQVSCKFTIEKPGTLKDFIDISKVPDELVKQIISQSEFTLTRSWSEDRSSELFVSEGDIHSYFLQEQEKKERNEQETIQIANKIKTQAEDLLLDIKNSENAIHEAKEQLKTFRKQRDNDAKAVKKAKKSDQKLIAEKQLEKSEKAYKEKEKKYLNTVDELEDQKKQYESIEDQHRLCTNLQDILESYDSITKEITQKKEEIQNFRHLSELSSSLRARKKNHIKLDRASRDLNKLRDELKRISIEKDITLAVSFLVETQNQNYNNAYNQVISDQERKNRYYTLKSLGAVFQQKIPVFEFFEDFSGLLPNKIDFEDILNKNVEVEGYQAARNFLRIAGLNSEIINENNQRILKQRIEKLNTEVTVNFQDYWSQKVGKNNKINLHFELEHYNYRDPEKKGKPYLEFWIKDNQNRLYPKQRSRGVRWFLSFYLELKAAEARKSGNRVLLIDEPGLSLHARAQEDVLKVFEDLKQTMQIIYCTHSPHLVKSDKLYRVLAVQRRDESDDRSETLLFDASLLSKASADTLTPVYSLLGVSPGEQNLISHKNNVIVPDATTYYYLQWLSKLIPGAESVKFIPATDQKTIPLLINIFISWQVGFNVLLFGKQSKSLLEQIKQLTLINGGSNISCNIFHESKVEIVEDYFSTLDFKKHILQKREGITETNSQYIVTNGLSRTILAANFVNSFEQNQLTLSDFDELTISSLKALFNKLLKTE